MRQLLTTTAGIRGINPDAKPSGNGCEECLASGGWWLHLNRCAQCGHVGCCNSSPNKHAQAHFHDTKHPITQRFEPGDESFYDWSADDYIDVPDSVKLHAPIHHPLNQPVPGGKVPAGI